MERFKELYELDIHDIVEQDYKGLNYISWANAYKLMIEEDNKATYEVLKDDQGFPMFEKANCYMVFTRVTMHGDTKEMYLPVMDNKHNAVNKDNITGRHVNDSIMRCLVKNIALFGIGLKLYIGEDIEKKATTQQLEQVDKLIQAAEDPTAKLAQIEKYYKKKITQLSENEANAIIKQLGGK